MPGLKIIKKIEKKTTKSHQHNEESERWKRKKKMKKKKPRFLFVLYTHPHRSIIRLLCAGCYGLHILFWGPTWCWWHLLSRLRIGTRGDDTWGFLALRGSSFLQTYCELALRKVLLYFSLFLQIPCSHEIITKSKGKRNIRRKCGKGYTSWLLKFIPNRWQMWS